MWFRKPSPPPAPEDCLPGRPEPMPVAERHHVLDSPLKPPWPDGTESIILAMGCFWGAERIFWQLPGVVTTAVGYSGGTTPNPTYAETCTGRTGHTESVLVVFRPSELDLSTILQEFWENHDPTQFMGQGNDIGSQYRTAIYTTTDAQLSAALTSRDRYQAKLTAAGYGDITTEITPAGPFYYAEDEHQQYLAKHPGGYCNHGFCQVRYD